MHRLCYPSSTDCMLSSSYALVILLYSSHTDIFKHCRAHRNTVLTLTETDSSTQTNFDHSLCHSVFPDHMTQWLNIKALWEGCIIRECSCGMQQNATQRDGFLWLHTIVMSLSTNNGEMCILPWKKIKPLELKKVIILWFLHCSEAPFFMEGCHQHSSHPPKHWKLISVLETVVGYRLSTARTWIMNWSMKDAPLPADIMG